MDEHREIDKAPFHIWLNRKYEEYVAANLGKGGVKRQSDFANYLDVSQNNLSQWILGKRVPDANSADKLATRLGMEVYDRLGLPRRMPKDRRLYYIVDHWTEFSEQEQKELLERARNIRTRKEENTRINPQQSFT